MRMPPIACVLMDIEGTTTPISFVHRVLFPYASARMAAVVARGADDAEIAAVLAETRAIAPDADPEVTLRHWADTDAKIGPLKTLQGIAWRAGYADGSLRAEIHPDVAPALRRWRQSGLRLAVYSSGSEEAQRLIFAHGPDGDLVPLLDAFFDTRVGGKREVASYAAIVRTLGVEPSAIVFLSDIADELDAADEAGLQTCQLVREGDDTVPTPAHRSAADFDIVSTLFGLPMP